MLSLVEAAQRLECSMVIVPIFGTVKIEWEGFRFGIEVMSGI